MTDIDLNELEAKAEAATGGPWEAYASSAPLSSTIRTDGGDTYIGSLGTHTNAEFIAAADPETVLALIERIERLEAILHEREAHPDYEYTTTDGPRKSAAVPDPTGEGWEKNVHRGWDGWERFDYHEEMYWMRRSNDDD